jgi:hypothetical protein
MLKNSAVIIKGKGRRESPVVKQKFICIEAHRHDGTQGRGDWRKQIFGIYKSGV